MTTCLQCGCSFPSGHEVAHRAVCGGSSAAPSTLASPVSYTLQFIQPSDDSLANKVQAVMAMAFDIWKDRQAKYGPSNIAATGAMGCYVRSVDKLARLKGVYLHGKSDMPDESIADTWLDLINYAVMGYMCHKDQWLEV